jgi:hypothetical protein
MSNTIKNLTNHSKYLLILLLLTSASPSIAVDRAEEIREEMWGGKDKNFKIMEVPQKWMTKSAVVIAQLNRYEYRKSIMLKLLRYNEYNHYRIKLNDKSAINNYAEMTYNVNRTDNASGEYIKVFVGYKIVKPNGKEIIVDLANAVTMEGQTKGSRQSYKKLAIPNLEVGDILDYYICEEVAKGTNALIYFFDPVIYHLPRQYPVMNHKLQFRAERRCYINLKSLNGAPELKLITDGSDEEQYYTLEENDIDPIEDQRWLYPYRELPSIKFRAAYASGKGLRAYNVLLGEPGLAKSAVTQTELEELAGTMFANNIYYIDLVGTAKKKLKKTIKEPLEIARQAYYLYRNEYFTKKAEVEALTVEGMAINEIAEIEFTDQFHKFLVKKKIPHDVIIAVPRHLSAMKDVLMENELEWLIRVRDGSNELYLSPFDVHSVAGTLDVSLEGTDAYALDGLAKKWKAKPIKLPVTSQAANRSEWLVEVQLNDFTKSNVTVKKTLTGRNKIGDQYSIMDFYDYKDEESKNFIMKETFGGYTGAAKKKYVALKDTYMASRKKNREDRLKETIENSFDLKAKNQGDLTITQTGRYHSEPAMVYSYKFETEDLVKKTGPNYLLSAGKILEKQTKIEAEEVKRNTNVYFDNARSFVFKVVIDIPKGYDVQGLEGFNQKSENRVGGFSSTAKVENGKILIETNKHYDVNFATKDQWPSIVTFLNAAYAFSEQKILLKKK